MWILDMLRKPEQTTVNTDGLDDLLEDGEAENVSDQDCETEWQ